MLPITFDNYGCFYHKDKKATNVCERCKKFICSEDTRIMRKKRKNNTTLHSEEALKQYYYCVPCYSTVHDNGSFVLILPF